MALRAKRIPTFPAFFFVSFVNFVVKISSPERPANDLASHWPPVQLSRATQANPVNPR